ncbi:hypothetical protein BDU57DRAFT_541644 [Ampelomyces quisqualis]|uniref:F-box domain-containing protein n=1 Tax=Ampelomyces quisqualis TaxID=50730 RepID=A0A6A5QDR9_AMPQU|nr:hypothetical protein BDU57DRAFT_541644 [Ampelomyces quisqualis]
MATNTPEAVITPGTIKSDLMTTNMFAPATEAEAVKTAMLNEINSPLLRLPPELRLLIFEYAVHCPGIVYKAKNNKASSHLRITNTSRQIFRETADLFYKTNTLTLHVWQIDNFVQALPEVGSQALRHIQLEEPSMELYFGSWAPRLEDLYEC